MNSLNFRYDRKKHTSPLHAAESELSEEARLHRGTWTQLLDSENTDGIPDLKISANRFTTFLCVDPENV